MPGIGARWITYPTGRRLLRVADGNSRHLAGRGAWIVAQCRRAGVEMQRGSGKDGGKGPHVAPGVRSRWTEEGKASDVEPSLSRLGALPTLAFASALRRICLPAACLWLAVGLPPICAGCMHASRASVSAKGGVSCAVFEPAWLTYGVPPPYLDRASRRFGHSGFAGSLPLLALLSICPRFASGGLREGCVQVAHCMHLGDVPGPLPRCRFGAGLVLVRSTFGLLLTYRPADPPVRTVPLSFPDRSTWRVPVRCRICASTHAHACPERAGIASAAFRDRSGFVPAGACPIRAPLRTGRALDRCSPVAPSLLPACNRTTPQTPISWCPFGALRRRGAPQPDALLTPF